MPGQDAARNPFEGVTDYFSELSRMRQIGAHGRDSSSEERQRTHASAWVPATDIRVSGEDLVIVVELAGVEPDEVDLSLSHGVLTVSGSRTPAAGAQDEAAFYVRERPYGKFRRTITLPDGTEPDQVAAVFDNGLVQVTVAGAAAQRDTSRIELRHGSTQAQHRTLG